MGEVLESGSWNQGNSQGFFVEPEGLQKGKASLDVVKISRKFAHTVKCVMDQDGLEIKLLAFATGQLSNTA